MNRRRHQWTPEQDAQLRQLYGKATTRTAKTRAIDIMMNVTGEARAMVRYRILKLGLSQDTRKPWTTEELQFLRRNAGKLTVDQIQETLHRSRGSISNRMDQLCLSRIVAKEGFTREGAAVVLGVCTYTINQWIRTEQLSCVDNRIPEASIIACFWKHLDSIDLRLVDQKWLKSQLVLVRPMRMRRPVEAA